MKKLFILALPLLLCAVLLTVPQTKSEAQVIGRYQEWKDMRDRGGLKVVITEWWSAFRRFVHL